MFMQQQEQLHKIEELAQKERLKKTGMFVSIAHVSAPSILKLATKYESHTASI